MSYTLRDETDPVKYWIQWMQRWRCREWTETDNGCISSLLSGAIQAVMLNVPTIW